jgi:glutamate 5-kinase
VSEATASSPTFVSGAMTLDAAGALDQARRVVVKVGSSLLVDRGSGLKREWLDSLVADIAGLAGSRQVLLVSSGAIALGRTILKLSSGELKLEESQAAAAVGQIALAKAYADALASHGLVAGQILLTLGDTEERRRYLNARATISTLLGLRAVPVINENDTVATAEIRYGDNDRLAARVAAMMSADLLVLLSDVDGLYTAPPATDPAAAHVPFVQQLTPEVAAMAGGAATRFSRGGMRTKIAAARIATEAGARMLIAQGQRLHPLGAVLDGARATLFERADSPVMARKRWIAGHLNAAGRLVIDRGAANALLNGKSLLPAGVRAVHGTFGRGDTILVVDDGGEEVARGLVSYDAVEARRIAGRRSDAVEEMLGPGARAAMIHRDDLVMARDFAGAGSAAADEVA